MGNHTTQDHSVSEDLRSTILINPRAAAEVVLDVELTDEVEVIVLEDTEDVRHIVLPGVMLKNAELSDISGGGGEKLLGVLTQKGEQIVLRKSFISAADHGWNPSSGRTLQEHREIQELCDFFQNAAEQSARNAVNRKIALGVGGTVLAGASAAGVAAWLNS